MICPVCKKEFKNLASHIIKTNNKEHIIFKQNHLNDMLNDFLNNKNIKDLNSILSTKEISSFIKKNCDFNNILKERNAKRTQNYHSGKIRKKTIKNKSKILKSFHTTLSIKRMTKKFKCHENTIKKIWINEYGKDNVLKRNKKIEKLYKKCSNKNYCLIENTKPESYKTVIKLFNSNKSINKIGKLVNISQATVANIYKRTFGKKEYNKRKIRIKESLINKIQKCCYIGSRNEILCFDLLKKIFKSTIHHDYRLVPKFEIDISIPELKTAIGWDGICHRKPIFGENNLKRVIIKDNLKKMILSEKKWKYIIVVDNGNFDENFVKNKVNEIINLINQDWNGVIEI